MADREFVRNTLLVAERGDRVVAFTYFGPHPDGMPDAEILDLYAHPSVWGTGVAWTLMDAVLDQLRDTRFRRVTRVDDGRRQPRPPLLRVVRLHEDTPNQGTRLRRRPPGP